MSTNIGVIPTGSVQYSAEEACTSIIDLIRALEEAKNYGITHVCLESGNYYGAHYMSIFSDDIMPIEDWDH